MSSSPLPGDASHDTAADHTGRFVRQPNGRIRPLSPHVQIWRWHVTMAASILFRVTIGAMSVAAVIAVGWLAALAFGPEAYAKVAACLGSPFGLFIGFGLTVVLISFILNGARHLTNDTGRALTLKPANLMSNIAVWGPIPLAVLFWVLLFATGRVSL
jgi:succinate dehydrogenase / fumarate reductase cytochrome b subunit